MPASSRSTWVDFGNPALSCPGSRSQGRHLGRRRSALLRHRAESAGGANRLDCLGAGQFLLTAGAKARAATGKVRSAACVPDEIGLGATVARRHTGDLCAPCGLSESVAPMERAAAAFWRAGTAHRTTQDSQCCPSCGSGLWRDGLIQRHRRYRHFRGTVGQFCGMGQIDQNLIFLIIDSGHVKRFENQRPAFGKHRFARVIR